MLCASCFNIVNIGKNCTACKGKHTFYLGGVNESMLQSVKDAYDAERETDLSPADLIAALNRQKRITECGLASTAGSFSGANKTFVKDKRKTHQYTVDINRPIGFLATDRLVYTFSRSDSRSAAIMHTIKFFVDRSQKPETEELILKQDTGSRIYMPISGAILFDKYCLVPIKDTSSDTGASNYNIVIVNRISNKVVGSLMYNNTELSLSDHFMIEHSKYETVVRLYADYKFGYVYVNHGNEIFVYKFTGRSRMPFEPERVLTFRKGNARVRCMSVNKDTGALYVVFRDELSEKNNVKNSSKYKLIEYLPQNKFAETILLYLEDVCAIIPIANKLYYLSVVSGKELHLIAVDKSDDILLWDRTLVSNFCYAESSPECTVLYLNNPRSSTAARDIYRLAINTDRNSCVSVCSAKKANNVLDELFELVEKPNSIIKESGQIIVKAASTNNLQVYLRNSGIRVDC